MAARKSAQRRRVNPAKFGSRTDIGCVREHNEDSLVVAPPLYAVADGMGGHAAGEVASEVAVRSLVENAPSSPDSKALGDAVVTANYAVINAAREKGRNGMGTTMTAAILEKRKLVLAQVGDSRAYLLHHGRLQQLTRDHSLMADMIEAGEITPEEARVHPQRSVITRALGSDPEMKPDLYEIEVDAGDRLLLCSDGLTTMLEDGDIEALLVRTRDPQRAASMLVNEAIANGGRDNVTVIVIDVEGDAPERERKLRRRGRAWGIFIVLALIAVVAAVLFGAYSYAQSTAYLVEQDGKVAVYAGSPDTILGMNFSHLDHVTDVEVDDLEPGVANRLKTGVIRADNLDAANSLVEGYEQYVQSRSSQDSQASSDSEAENDTASANSANTGSNTGEAAENQASSANANNGASSNQESEG